MAVFHATCSFGDHLSGRSRSLEIPWPVGPRNRGQFSADARVVKAMSSRDGIAIVVIRRHALLVHLLRIERLRFGRMLSNVIPLLRCDRLFVGAPGCWQRRHCWFVRGSYACGFEVTGSATS
jgi:hypothetical protein